MTISKQIYANNAKTTTSSAVLPGDTVIQVSNAGIFPVPTAGTWFTATLEAAGVIEVIRVYGVVGNSFTGCVRGLEGTVASPFPAGTRIDNRATAAAFSAFARLIDRMDEVSSVDVLDTPLNSNSNSYICHSLDVSGNPIVAFRNSDTGWRFNTHQVVQVQGSTTSATTTSVVSSNIANFIPTVNAGAFIIQYATGSNAGLARMITGSGTNTVSWATALPNVPGVGDQFEIYKSTTQLMSELLTSPDNYFGVASGTSDSLTLTTTPSIGFSLVDGKQVKVRLSGTPNTTTAPTINVNTTGAKLITRTGGQAMPIGGLLPNQELLLRYNITTDTYEALNASATVTAPQYDSSTKTATTAFVQRAIGNRSNLIGISTPTTLTAANSGNAMLISGGVATTLPLAASVISGTVLYFASTVGGASITPNGSDTISFKGTSVSSIILNTGDTLELVSNGVTWYALSGTAMLPYSTIMSGANWTTAPQLDNTTKLATTAFVKAAGEQYSNFLAPAGSTVLTLGNLGALTYLSNSGTTSTFPSISTCPAGTTINVQAGFASGSSLLKGFGGDLLVNQFNSGANTFVLNAGESVQFIANGVNWYLSSYSASVGVTPAQFDNTARLATTAFVKNSGDTYSNLISVVSTSTLTVLNVGALTSVGANGTTQTLPPVASVPAGSIISVSAQFAAGNVTLKANASESIVNQFQTPSNTFTLNAGESVRLVNYTGSNWNVMSYSAVGGVTPAQFDNSTKLATTAFVQKALGNKQQVVSLTTSQTVLYSMAGSLITTIGATGAITLTIPNAAGVTPGVTYTVVNPTAYAITLVSATNNFAGPLGGGPNVVIPPAVGSTHLGIDLVSDGASWFTSTSFGISSTPSNSDNSPRIATTAYVKNQNYQAALGFTPVQQGTGVAQLPNVVKIGWTGTNLNATVDATDQGSFVFMGYLNTQLSNKVSGSSSIVLNWSGLGGQPTWLFGGNAPGSVNVYNPSNFSVASATNASYATNAGNASTANTATSATNATNSTFAYASTYANILAGQGLTVGGIGGYILNKDYITNPPSGYGGSWQLCGYAYDYGSGGDGGINTRTALWQRTA